MEKEMRVVLVSLFFIGVLGLFIFSNFVMTGNIVNSAIMPPQGVEKIVVGEINATAWPTPLLSKEGEKFFYFAGTYLDNPSETNDYAYYTWNGGEDSNQAGRKIKSGDVLSFWSWTPNWNEEVNKIKKYPSCGIEINFVDDKNNLTSETLRWNYVDQDNIVSVKGNEKIKANWYQRNISLSDFDGREIKFISFVQQTKRDVGEKWWCAYDGVKIIGEGEVMTDESGDDGFVANESSDFEVVEESCIDRDGGLNYMLKGFTKGKDFMTNEIVEAKDYCDDKGYLQEYFCDPNGNIARLRFPCSQVMNNLNAYCFEGKCVVDDSKHYSLKCVSNTGTANDFNHLDWHRGNCNPLNCEGGQETFVKCNEERRNVGWAFFSYTVPYQSEVCRKSYFSECSEISSCAVGYKELSGSKKQCVCDGIGCMNPSENGSAVISSEMTGDEIYVNGVYQGKTPFTFSRSEGNYNVMLRRSGEVISSGDINIIQSQRVILPQIKKRICEDSDGGIMPLEGGIVATGNWPSGGMSQIYDRCNGVQVVEHFCDGTEVKTKTITCPNGCLNGACKDFTATACRKEGSNIIRSLNNKEIISGKDGCYDMYTQSLAKCNSYNAVEYVQGKCGLGKVCSWGQCVDGGILSADSLPRGMEVSIDTGIYKGFLKNESGDMLKTPFQTQVPPGLWYYIQGSNGYSYTLKEQLSIFSGKTTSWRGTLVEPIEIVCNTDSYNCVDFSIWAEAQIILNYCGVSTDVHNLDGDADFIACEVLLLEGTTSEPHIIPRVNHWVDGSVGSIACFDLKTDSTNTENNNFKNCFKNFCQSQGGLIDSTVHPVSSTVFPECNTGYNAAVFCYADLTGLDNPC